jgi:asparagine synthase (glutamine-hydrolysing)
MRRGADLTMSESKSPAAGGAHPRWPEGCHTWGEAAEQLGPLEAAARASGAFAVSAELADGRLVAAVDRFARQTLCVGQVDGRPAVRPAATDFGVSDLDPQAIYDYLFFHAIPSPRTIFRGVQRSPAGHVATWDGQSFRFARFGCLRFAPTRMPAFYAVKSEFRRLLTEAVAAELGDGIPACFLSGGTDSSTIAGHIKQIAGEVHTYSIGFDAEGYDEMEYARIAARHFGAVHHEYYVTPQDLVDSIAHVAAAYDQPFGNSSALPAYYCALRAREDGVRKLLAGDGGDELFGGNERYASQKVYEVWDGVPAWVRNGLVKPVLAVPGADRVAVFRRGRNYVRDAERGLPDRLHHYNLLLRLGPEQLLTQGFLHQVRTDSVFEQQREVWALAQADNVLDRHLAYDWRYTLAESDLPKVRGAAALAGIEVGYPMLYDPLVDFSLTLPPDYKVKGRQLRWFFKEALRDFLPSEVITKQKKGFGLPFGVWATKHSALNALATDSVRAFGTRGVVRPGFVDRLLGEYLPAHPGYYGEMVWILMMLEQWLRRHAPDWRLGQN